MKTKNTSIRRSSTRINSKNQTDEELIKRIAEAKENEAFYELFRRYRTCCFSLAMRIVKNHSIAEDVLQESMVRIWEKAGTYRPNSASARTWIFRIVTFRSLSALQKTKSKGMEFLSEEVSETIPNNEFNLSHEKEIKIALRNSLHQLTELDRQLVILQFGGGMTQKEVGEKFAITRQVVAYRTQKALAALRSHLTKLGFCASIPDLEINLSDTICSGFETNLPFTSLFSASEILSSNTMGTTSNWVLKLFAVSCITAATFIGLKIYPGQAKQEENFQRKISKRLPKTMSAVDIKEIKNTQTNSCSLPRVWSFYKKIPKEWEVVFGEYTYWKRNQEINKKPRLQILPGLVTASPTQGVNLLLKPKIFDSPFVLLAYCMNPDEGGKNIFKARWVRDEVPLPYKRWIRSQRSKPGIRTNPSQIYTTYAFYFIKNRIYIMENSSYVEVFEYSEKPQGNQVMLSAKNIALRGIDMNALKEIHAGIAVLKKVKCDLEPDFPF